MKTKTISINIAPDSYDVYMKGNVIQRIVKFIGENQIQREVTLESLPDKVRIEILEEIIASL